MDSCKQCCGSCGGCSKALELTAPEVQMLLQLGQIPFLPVARRAEDMTPIYLEERELPVQTYSLVLQCLEKRGLISIDYDMPLKGFDMTAYQGYPVHGSFALTCRGQAVLELLEKQGVVDCR